jgi:hypothetical protein
VNNKTEIKQTTPEKEGYADACTIIPQNDIMIYNVVKRVIDDNKINDYNSIPLVVKKYITEKFICQVILKIRLPFCCFYGKINKILYFKVEQNETYNSRKAEPCAKHSSRHRRNVEKKRLF